MRSSASNTLHTTQVALKRISHTLKRPTTAAAEVGTQEHRRLLALPSPMSKKPARQRAEELRKPLLGPLAEVRLGSRRRPLDSGGDCSAASRGAPACTWLDHENG